VRDNPGKIGGDSTCRKSREKKGFEGQKVRQKEGEENQKAARERSEERVYKDLEVKEDDHVERKTRKRTRFHPGGVNIRERTISPTRTSGQKTHKKCERTLREEREQTGQEELRIW